MLPINFNSGPKSKQWKKKTEITDYIGQPNKREVVHDEPIGLPTVPPNKHEVVDEIPEAVTGTGPSVFPAVSTLPSSSGGESSDVVKATGGTVAGKTVPGHGKHPMSLGGPKKPRRYRPGSNALREIRKYQRSTCLLMPKSRFQSLVREIAQNVGQPGHLRRFTPEALLCLQEAAEAYMTYMMASTNKCAMHANRVTIQPKDMKLVKELSDYN